MYLKLLFSIIVFSIIGNYNHVGICDCCTNCWENLCSKIGWGGGISNSQLQNVINANKGRVIKGTFKVEDANTEVRIIGYKDKYIKESQNSNDKENNINIARTDPIERVEHIYIRKQNSGENWREIEKKDLDDKGVYKGPIETTTYEVCYVFKEKTGINKPIEDMSYMFFECKISIELDVTNFNTKNVKDMSWMFAYCRKLDKLDLINWETDNVTDMNHMFCGCWILTTLTLTNFNTQKVTNMNGMFADCKKLISLDLSSFNTENVTNMSRMFARCGSLKKLNVIRFDIGKNADITSMFDGHNDSLEVTYQLPGPEKLCKILDSCGIGYKVIYF